MEPNMEFDNNTTEETTMEHTPTTNAPLNQPRVVNLSQKEIAAYTAMGWNNARLATHYGVKSTDIYRAKEKFGLYTARTNKAEAAPAYVINLDFDMPSMTTEVISDVQA